MPTEEPACAGETRWRILETSGTLSGGETEIRLLSLLPIVSVSFGWQIPSLPSSNIGLDFFEGLGDLAGRGQEDLQSDLVEPTVPTVAGMKRVMCGKMAVAYQKNIDIGKGPGSVVFKVGPKGGQQHQCSEGSSKNSYKMQPDNQNDTPVWNIIALSMCLRPQSPDSNVCLAPASPLSSSTPSSNSPSATFGRSTSDGGEKLPSPSFATSRNYSSLGGSLKDGLDQEKRSQSRCSTDSDEEKCRVSHFEDQFGGLRVIQTYGTHIGSSRLFVGQSHEAHMGGPELSSSSSSIGGCDDSPCSSVEGSTEVSSSGDMEVESTLRSGPLHHMSELEASLPIKRGLSRFWNGKAKSFSSLADVSSIEELAKPENPYARRRRTTFGERHKSFPPLSRTSTAGISKKPTSNSGNRGGLAMAVAMGSKLVEAPNSNQQQCSPSTYVYSSRSTSLTDLGQATSDTGEGRICMYKGSSAAARKTINISDNIKYTWTPMAGQTFYLHVCHGDEPHAKESMVVQSSEGKLEVLQGHFTSRVATQNHTTERSIDEIERQAEQESLTAAGLKQADIPSKQALGSKASQGFMMRKH